MYTDTKNKIKNTVELWLEDLGYKFNTNLYGQVEKMCYYSPSYRVIADVTLKNIKRHSPIINSDEAWGYTTSFVNGMKSNLISNNNYFQCVFKDGLFNPLSNKQDKHINLFDVHIFRNNDYNFLENIRVSSKEYSRIFDFIILINGFPLLMIDIVDKKNFDSFAKAFDRVEDSFDKFPMLFNFNKLILLTDGTRYRLGTLYDFPEEYIEFSDKIEDSVEGTRHSREMLEKILAPKNIIKYLKENKDIHGIQDHMKESVKEESKIVCRKDLQKSEIKIDEILNKERKIDQKNTIQKEKGLEEVDELSFLASIFNSDLNKIIDSKEFEKKLEKIEEVPDFRENKAYIEDIQKNKNIDTLETFVTANKRLVIKEIHRYIGYQTTSMEYDDMYQWGCIGLLKAVERFDLEKENEFSTYAIYWIRQSIMRGISNESLLIRVPVHTRESIEKLRVLENKSNIYFDKVDYDWISKELGESKDKIMDLISIRNSYMTNVSLDTIVGEENTTLGELIADGDYNVEEIVLDSDLKKRIEETLNTIDDRSKDILVRRFGLNGEGPMTLEEVGKLYDLTRERIRQIENKALRKLRHPNRSRKFKEYCEGYYDRENKRDIKNNRRKV
ncbi:sigma-70 family RNA polymerase sigma factor [Clostridium algidicarnis]|uniref:sigma-70 family RNA polymerase sigma factor n=1 Tax=Clostridium algidicarnis TaxID=37659 RepID=UPI00162AF2D8|nr:sigma-70 family RNA polymerase sigma factor [Clostridium algidicarnis]MBB6696661.1 sigma-70 family RNA polymerase sigma factor [Clostridium algidicarnis]